MHLSLAVLRSAGIPARYVSGYLFSEPESDVGTVHQGQSHAWLEAWTGDWRPVDPTSGDAVGERHVVVARGRLFGEGFRAADGGAPGCNST